MTESSPPAIAVRDLTFRYPNGHAALQRISFTVDRGERLAIVGPNGAGKSTLLLHLNGLLPATWNPNGHAAEVTVLGAPVGKARLAEVRRQVGFVFQDPDDQLFCSTVAEDVAFGPTNFGIRDGDLAARVRRCLEQVGLPDHGPRMIGQLSFGERKRVCLAGVLACDPAILVLDEPTANLDPRARRQLLAIIRNTSATLVMATHDLEFVLDACRRVLVLDEGRLVADGPAAEILADDILMDRHGLEVPWRLRR
jgi:energy-coupling factor transporter ATP-binding protein EcfA2